MNEVFDILDLPEVQDGDEIEIIGSNPNEYQLWEVDVNNNGQKELNTAFLGGNGNLGKWVGTEVKEWCKTKATEGSVCVLGKSIKKDQAQSMKLPAAIGMAKGDNYTVEKVSPTYIGEFEEDSGDGTKQIKHYFGAVYSKS